MCYSEFNAILKWIAAMDADVISIEASRSNMDLLQAFVDFKYPSARNTGAPRTGLTVYRPGKLWVNPDCGLKTRGWPETLLSLGNMVQAVRVLREEYSDTQNKITR